MKPYKRRTYGSATRLKKGKMSSAPTELTDRPFDGDRLMLALLWTH